MFRKVDSQQGLMNRRLRHKLELQSQQIERVFSRHRLPAQIAGGEANTRHTNFDLGSQLSIGFDKLLALTVELKRALGAPAVSWMRDHGSLQLRVENVDDVPVPMLELLDWLSDVPSMTAVLGIADDGRPLLIDFSADDVNHVLLSGAADSGKSSLMRSLAMSLALTNKQSKLQLLVAVADGTRERELLEPLSFLPHMLAPVLYQPDEVLDVLEFLVCEIPRRIEQSVRTPTILLMIDGVVSLMERGRGEMIDYLKQIIQQGASAGIHLVMSTRRPDSELLDVQIRSDLSVRIVGRVKDNRLAAAASGLRESRAEYLVGKGDFLALIDGGEAIPFQAGYLGSYDLHLCLEELQRNRPPSLLARSLNEDSRSTKDDGEQRGEITAEAQSFSYDGESVSWDSSVKLECPAERESENNDLTSIEGSVS